MQLIISFLSRLYFYLFIHYSIDCYSVLKFFTGFANAALIAWRLTVTIAIEMATKAANTKTHHFIWMRYAKSCSHLFMNHHAIGKAIRDAISTNLKKSLDNIPTILLTVAPNTFLIPISFVFCSAAYAANPNRPRQAIKIASTAKEIKILPALSSERYMSSNSSFKKE